jgi:uncharacterized protein (DUF302 family)
MGKWWRVLTIMVGLTIAPDGGAAQSNSGLVTLASHHAEAETIDRFEAAVKAKGWTVFTRIDHAAAAKAVGLDLRPRTVVIFGNPQGGTDQMRSNPTLAIDLPMKALVWQDDAGKVWLTYNAADYLGTALYPRHGLAVPPEARKGLAQVLEGFARQATE